MTNNNHVEEFRRVLEAAGLAPAEIVGDGSLHRCPTADKPNGKDGAYILHLDGRVSGWWQNWRTGESETWTAEGQAKMSPAEKKAFRERIERDKRKRQEEQAEVHREAAAKAQAMFDSLAKVTADNPYLKLKGVTPAGDLRVTSYGRLVVPVLGSDGNVQSLQFISADGKEKLFLPGGKVTGCFFPINGDNGRLYIVEGLATGLSVFEATDSTVFCAFDAGKIKAVAEMARKLYPSREIVIAGDNDTKTEGNPGRTKAEAAARAVGGKWVVPLFEDRPDLSDFNDLHQLLGLDAVRKRLAQAKAPAQQGVPRGFMLKKDGVYFLEEDKDETIQRWVCTPLRVVAQTRDETGKSWGVLLELTDPDGNKKKWAMPNSMTSGSGEAFRSCLLDLGLRIASGFKSRDRLRDYITLSNPPTRALCVGRSGWYSERFVLPSITIGPDKGERVVYQGIVAEDLFQVSGTLEEWQDKIGRLCAGNSRFAFAVSIAFAAPLLHLLHAESGGFHFFGGSSAGKTTLAEVAGSVCGGGGLHGFIRQWETTVNALEGQATAHCDTLLVLDEISQAAAKTVYSSTYMLANGQGKGRSTQEGHNRKLNQWRIIFISTGEDTLPAFLLKDKLKMNAGQGVRMPDIPSDAGKGMKTIECLHEFESSEDLASHFKEFSKKIYGSPFRAYLEKLTTDRSVATLFSKEKRDAFKSTYLPAGADSQVSRVCNRFAIVAAAGELATSYGILPWQQGEAFKAASICFSAWLDARGGLGSAELKDGLSQVCMFFQLHGSSRFENLDNEIEQRIVNRAGYRKRINGEDCFCVFPEVFRTEICQGLDSKYIGAELERLGLLHTDHGRQTKKVWIDGTSKSFFVLPITILSGNDGNVGKGTEITGQKPFPTSGNGPGMNGNVNPGNQNPSHSFPNLPNEMGMENVNNSGSLPDIPNIPKEKGKEQTKKDSDSSTATSPRQRQVTI